jgi:Glu-tRNA(Gln) amidotransferase subunit E-like FAD-binding protein
MSTVDSIVSQASELSDRERAAIVERLLEGLPTPNYDVSDEEVQERRRELESGEVEDISLAELKAGLDL